MDDPWGSPWASNTSTIADASERKTHSRTPSPSKSSLEPPPRAFLSTTGSSPRIQPLAGQSPWVEEDDDGFGDWATADAGANSASNGHAQQPGWNAWDRNDATPLGGSSGLTPPEDVFGKATPIAWPESAATPLGRRTSQNNLFRQPSPDPWASEFHFGEEAKEPKTTPTLVVDIPASADATSAGVVAVRQEEAGQPEPTTGEPSSQTISVLERPEDMGDEAALTSASTVSVQESVETPGDRESYRLEEHAISRPSSRSDDSDQETHRQDSPITSIDEEPKVRPTAGTPQRKSSGKVQVLVEKFDGLARSSSVEPEIVTRDRSKSRTRLDEDAAEDDGADFGDFEEGGEFEEEPASAVSAETVIPKEATQPTPLSPPPPALEEASPASDDAPSDPAPAPAPAAVESIAALTDLAAKYGNPKFLVDPAKADALFEGLQIQGDASGADADVSEHIIQDNFTEISERKAWYRVSRLGSSRKHNAGDDENYRLVAWKTSTAHADTIKIVRRWMEEDSISGRPVLGGGPAKLKGFGWDSAAEPVGLDTVFGRRGNKAHSRAASLQQPPLPMMTPPTPAASMIANGLRRTSRELGSPMDRPLSLSAAPVAAFGWSSDPAHDPTPMQPSNALAGPPAAPSFLKAFAPPPAHPPKPVSINAPPSKPAVAPVQTVFADTEEDDEWGEMVTSPPDSGRPGGDERDAPYSAASPQVPQSFGLAFDPAPSALAPAPAPASMQKPSQHVSFAPSAITGSVPPSTHNPPQLDIISDPWDFSAFETPKTTMEPATKMSLPLSATSFSPSTPIHIASPLTISGDTPTQSPMKRTEQHTTASEDAAVRSIVANLPDLTYMLR